MRVSFFLSFPLSVMPITFEKFFLARSSRCLYLDCRAWLGVLKAEPKASTNFKIQFKFDLHQQFRMASSMTIFPGILLILSGVSLLFTVIGTTTSYWETVGNFEANEVHYGLFRRCRKRFPMPSIETCSKYDSWTQPDWLNTVQAFLTLAVIWNSLVIVGIFVLLVRNQQQNAKFIGIGQLSTFLFCLIGMSVFTANSRVSLKIKESVHKDKSNYEDKELTYGGSYIIAWLGVLLALAGGLLGLIKAVKERTSNQQSQPGKRGIENSGGPQQQNGGENH